MRRIRRRGTSSAKRKDEKKPIPLEHLDKVMFAHQTLGVGERGRRAHQKGRGKRLFSFAKNLHYRKQGIPIIIIKGGGKVMEAFSSNKGGVGEGSGRSGGVFRGRVGGRTSTSCRKADRTFRKEERRLTRRKKAKKKFRELVREGRKSGKGWGARQFVKRSENTGDPKIQEKKEKKVNYCAWI